MTHRNESKLGGWLSLALIAAAIPGAAEEAKAPANVAYVDVNDLLQNFEDYKQKNEGYKEFVRTRLIQRNQRVYLADEEWTELDNLQAKAADKLTDPEKARIKELESLSQTRDKEMTDLQGLPAPTPEQTERRKQLNEVVSKNRKKIDEINAKFDQEVKTKEQELLAELKEKIRKAVEQVASEKGFVLVLEKALLLYGVEALDITQAVLQRLNKPAG